MFDAPNLGEAFPFWNSSGTEPHEIQIEAIAQYCEALVLYERLEDAPPGYWETAMKRLSQ